MKSVRFLLIFFLYSLAFDAQAQKEAYTWYLGDSLALDFNVQPPAVRQEGPAGPGGGNIATHSDSKEIYYYSRQSHSTHG